MVDPANPIYDNTKPMGKMMWLPVLFVVIAITVTACMLYSSLADTKEHSAQPTILILAALWAVGAPVWFFIEYYFFYKKAAAPDSWELFKHGQQLAIAVWAGIAAALYVLGSSDLAKAQKPEFACTIEVVASVLSASASQPATVKCKKASDFKVPVRRQDDGDNGECNDEQASQWKSALFFSASWSEPGCR